MKKLMIAAAIVCAAAFAQAANYNWGNGSYSIDNWNGNQPMNPDLEAPMFDSGKMLLPSLPVENSKIAFPSKPACVFRLRAS